MPTHRKSPLFIRITTFKNKVVCVNPYELSSFQIIEKAKIRIKKPAEGQPDFVVADTIHFYFPSGMGLTYIVGEDISQEEFNYVCATLAEFMYMNEQEFKARSEKIKADQMADWNALSEENSKKISELETPVPGV